MCLMNLTFQYVDNIAENMINQTLAIIPSFPKILVKMPIIQDIEEKWKFDKIERIFFSDILCNF